MKLYAAAMLPGFFLTFLYLIYILGWAMINPKIAPKLLPIIPSRGTGLAQAAGARRARCVFFGVTAASRPSLVRSATTPDAVRLRHAVIINNVLALMVPGAPVAPSPRLIGMWLSIAPPAAQTVAAPITAVTPATEPDTQAAPAPADETPQELGVAAPE